PSERVSRTVSSDADVLELADLDVRTEASRLLRFEAARAHLERRRGACGDRVLQCLFGRTSRGVRCDVGGEQDVAAADAGDRLDQRRRRPVAARLAALAEPCEAAALVRDQDVPRTQLGDVLEREREVLALVELLADE